MKAPKKILWHDIVIVIALAIHLITFFMTKYMLMALISIPEIGETAKQLESDPVARASLDISYGLEKVAIVTTGMLLACYISIRQYRERNIYTKFAHNLFTMITLWIYLQNFVSDLPVFLRVVLGW